ncbi:putative aminopeptidase ysdC [Candidatus Phytoplasma oryzae]|uniref:Peptidase M28 n=1 Tax=Candidatus Phytoplasma oryzae TaxID=203274 RepID=A0A139JQT8_9MOLU|nr:M42 family metallopeptidase [Candidatus Phytoplasma oryzae]KXT29308.1 putative aminopeptidase ysdC [Candidatus Phytoplasma oryzae]RAM57863.1 peptidase M28 [Candidatus Phytoplasma oryzae]
MSDLLSQIKELTTLNGVPGQEKEVMLYIKENIQKFVDKIEYDNLGSMIAYKGLLKGPKILLASHVDEIGLIVTEITPEGFIKFQTLGGWLSSVMLAQVWQIHTSKGVLYGVTGSKPPHVLSLAERDKMPNIKNFFLDLGVQNKQEAEELGVKIGDMITPYTEFRVLGNSNFLVSKAIDNRVGVLIVMEILRILNNNPNQFIGAFTVQEEVGLRGAITSTNKTKPSIAIAVDTGIADDIPGEKNVSQKILGNGPQIPVFDYGLVAHKSLRELVLKIAKENNIPFQEPKPTGGQTDAAAMHLQNEGAASIVIGVPTRYIHSHTSIVHKEDIENTIKLLLLLIKSLNEEKVRKILFN